MAMAAAFARIAGSSPNSWMAARPDILIQLQQLRTLFIAIGQTFSADHLPHHKGSPVAVAQPAERPSATPAIGASAACPAISISPMRISFPPYLRFIYHNDTVYRIFAHFSSLLLHFSAGSSIITVLNITNRADT